MKSICYINFDFTSIFENVVIEPKGFTATKLTKNDMGFKDLGAEFKY